jgi:ATP-dependent protease ClpP protease subunit
MATYDIEIDGFIGNGGYSKSFVAQKLNACKKKKVQIRMNSMGGSLDHGLDICSRIANHGDVQVDLFGFNASSATIATLQAKKVCMADNGFYLINKVMNVVDILGNLNADEIAQIIADLTNNMEENNKIDAVIAQMYATKTGKPLNEMLDLMKAGGWLNAKEALDYGFVDELIKATEKTNYKGIEDKLNAFGLPTTRVNSSELFTIKNKIEMKKQPIKVNAVIGVEKLEADTDGVFLNETQIVAIETKITELENSLNTEKTATTAAVTRAETAENAVSASATKITDLETQIENLKKGAGAKTTTVVKETDGTDGDEPDEFANTVKSAKSLFAQIP